MPGNASITPRSTRPISLGIIGWGYAGQHQFRAAASIPQLNVVGVSDAVVSPGDGQVIGVPFHQDWRHFLEDAEVDAVSVCLPHHLHAQVTKAAMQAGKHVLLEKPIAGTLEEGRRIVEASRASSPVLMVEMTHRFYPPVIQAREFVRSGRLGRIFAVEDRIIEWVPPNGLPGWMFETESAGGGVALTNGIHMLDRVAWVCGQSLRFRDGIAGTTQNLGDVEDTASMHLSLADGTPVNLLTSWPRGTVGQDDELTIYGTSGTLRTWAWRGCRFEPADGADIEEHISYAEEQDESARVEIGMVGALTEFVAAIREEREPSPRAEEILAIQEIIEQFYQAVGR